MYISSNEITVTWVLGPTDSPLAESAYDISIIPSSLEGSYTDAGIINYVSPTEDTAGSIQYKFTPTAKGRYQLILSTGTSTSYTELDRKLYWVFQDVTSSSTSEKVLGGLSYPLFPKNASSTIVWGSPSWRNITAISFDESAQEILIVGVREFGDSFGTLQIMSKDGQTYTDYPTLPFTDPKAVCRESGGRVYVLKSGQSAGNIYDCYYSDAPYSTWTLATFPSNAFAGNRNIFYDPYQDKVWWCQGTRLYVADGGSDTFVIQQYDQFNGGSAANIGESNFWYRFTTGGNSIWYSGSLALAGPYAGQERFHRCNLGPGAGTPNAWQQVYDENDAWGATYTSNPPTMMAQNANKDKTFALGSAGIMIQTTDGTIWTDPLIDMNSKAPALLNRLNFFNCFGKLFIAGTASGGVTQWWESSDDAQTWTLSTDTRLVSYQMGDTAQFSNNFFATLDNSGIAFIDLSLNPGFEYQVIIAV